MRKKCVMALSLAAAVLALIFLTQELQAASKDMVATKREVFQDDTSVSMRDMFAKRQAEEEEYRKVLMADSKESVRLLREIRDLLKDLNAKE